MANNSLSDFLDAKYTSPKLPFPNNLWNMYASGDVN